MSAISTLWRCAHVSIINNINFALVFECMCVCVWGEMMINAQNNTNKR